MRNDLTNSLNAYKTKNLDQSWLCHLRYGHLHFGGLDFLQKKKIIKGFPSIEQLARSCERFILGKNHRDKFISGVSYREKAPLEIVHVDLCGPMQIPSLTGNVYFMSFIDDYSRKNWVYLLKQESQAFDVFKSFKAMAEKESNKFIKVFRLDGGGEYMSNECMDFCKHYGIKR